MEGGRPRFMRSSVMRHGLDAPAGTPIVDPAGPTATEDAPSPTTSLTPVPPTPCQDLPTGTEDGEAGLRRETR